MARTSRTSYDMTAIGFLADDVVFAVGAAARGQRLGAEDREAIEGAVGFLEALATLDEDSKGAPQIGQLRELVSSRKHVVRAANATAGQVKEVLVEMRRKLQGLVAAVPPEPHPAEYKDVLDFFEGLGQVSLSEVRRVTEGTQPTWMSSLPTGLY